MKKVFISQPIKDRTEKEIKETREKAIKYLESQGYEVADSYFKNEQETLEKFPHPSLYWIGKSIQKMAECDIIYFTTGWTLARGCRIERLAAILYGLEMIEEE